MVKWPGFSRLRSVLACVFYDVPYYSLCLKSTKEGRSSGFNGIKELLCGGGIPTLGT